MAELVQAKGHPANQPACTWDCMCEVDNVDSSGLSRLSGETEVAQCENAGGCPAQRTDCGWGV